MLQALFGAPAVRRLMGAAAAAVVLSGPASAQAQETDTDGATQRFLLSAPPREAPAVGEEVYGPVAEFLSRSTGHRFIYEHPDNPLLYWENLQRNRYDVVFDESHFISWLILNHQHLPLVRVSGALIYVYFVNEAGDQPSTLADFAGRTVCGQSPPNQGTLALYERFENPFRLPHLVPMELWN